LTMENAIVLSSTVEQAITSAIANCNALALVGLEPLQQAVRLATGMTQLRRALTDDIIESIFMPLQSSKLGFVTDRDKPAWNATPDEVRNFKKGYPIPVVRDVLIEAFMNGLRPVNNEFNILAGNLYAAKNGLDRLVSEFPGVSNLDVVSSPPQVNEKGDTAKVSIRADWDLGGKHYSLVREATKGEKGEINDTRITIRVNKGMGLDAVLGKAERKLYHAVLAKLRRMNGMALTLADGEAIDTDGTQVDAPSLATPEQEGKRVKLSPKPPREAPPVEAAPMREPGMEG
jgi:hypothetical protein